MKSSESKIQNYAHRLSSLEQKELHCLRALLSRAINEEVTPGISLWIGIDPQPDGMRAERMICEGRVEPQGLSQIINSESVYDLASLTKPLACAFWFASLVSQGKLDPHQPIQHLIKCEDHLLGQAPVWRLVNHSSGLPAHHSYHIGFIHARMNGGPPARFKKIVRRMIAATQTIYFPGEKSVYSDLGYLLLEYICEIVSGEDLLSFWTRTHPDGSLHFNPLPTITEAMPQRLSSYVPTERCPWRERLLQGEVHDDNAWLIGGVCGHAGLFGTARAVGLEAASWLRCFHGESTSSLISTDVAQWMMSLARRAPMKGSFVLGWDTPSPGYSSAGQYFTRHTVGHLGFTGTSLWMDLEQRILMVILTNRVYPDRNRSQSIQGIRWLRPQIHNEIWRLIQ